MRSMYLSRLLAGAAIALSLLFPQAAAQALGEADEFAFFSVADGALFAHLKQQHALLFSAAGPAWHPVTNAAGAPLHADTAAEAGGALWAVADGAVWRLASDVENVSVTLPVGFAYRSLRPHPSNPECVLVNGADSAALGCLEWSNSTPLLRSVDGVTHCEFLGAAQNSLDYVCVASKPDAALQVHSVNEAPHSVEIDGRAVVAVEQLVRTPTHVAAVVRAKHGLELALYSLESGSWSWAATPPAHKSTHLEILNDPYAFLLIADSSARGHDRQLWAANSKGSELTMRVALDRGAGVKAVGRALYSVDSQKRVILSKDHGHSWTADMEVVPDIASICTSERLNAGFNAEKTKLVVSHDGLDWRVHPIPFADGENEIVLFDHGSAIMVWSRSDNKVPWSVTGGSSVFVTPLLQNLPGPRDEVLAFSDGPRVFMAHKQHSAAEFSPHFLDMTHSLGNRACAATDLELVQDSECVLGTRESLWIRKSDAIHTMDDNCIMGPRDYYPSPPSESCACTIADYECDDMFVPSDGHLCTPGPVLSSKLAQCSRDEHQYVSKGYRLIAGNRCQGGEQLSGVTYHDCESGEIMAAAAPQSVNSKVKEFDGQFSDYLYLPSTQAAETDETVLVYTMAGDLFVSQDQGGVWQQQPNIKNILSLFKSETAANQVYIFTADSVDRQSIWVSWDRGRSFEEINLPAPPAVIYGIMPNVVTFHPKHPEWMMYTGTDPDCKTIFDCPGVSYLSKDKGKRWTKIHDSTSTCQWVYGLVNPTNDDLTYCFIQTESILNILDFGFVYSEDYFTHDNHTVPGLERVLATALDKPFVVAARNQPNSAEIDGFVSLNGKDFAEIKFPPSVKFDKESGFTLISTQTQSILMFATANSRMEHEYGVLLKSNSNGTDFVVTLENVNRGAGLFGGFVDFERVKSIEGVAIANVVANVDDVVRKGEAKKLQTVITHSDGSLWAPLDAPKGMCDGKPKCRLHLHGFTERLDPRNSPSSPSAVGLIVARGNVGEYLDEMRSAQTFMSRDGGVTWIKVNDRPMFWEFGDSGSIVVLLDSQEPTNTLYYTLDEGDTWNEYEFNDVPIKVKNIATIPSDSSRKFIVFGLPPVAYGDKTLAIQIDFSGVTDKKCGDSDFELWTPKHPQTNSPCLFGHEAQYQRKIRGKACYVGKSFSQKDGTVQKPPVNLKTCECQRSDYECDFNYKLDPNDGTCKLEDGLESPSREQQCKGGAVAWHKVTGYRKIPISTCEGGQILSSDEEYACPGMEDEFNRQRGSKPGKRPKGRPILGFLVLFVLIVSLILIGVSGYIWAKRHGWASQNLPVSLPESFDSNAMLSASAHSSLEFLEKAWVQVSDLWAMIVTHLPLVGPQSPRDHMGFYSRMDDERYRILESDEFEDDESEEETPPEQPDSDI